MAMCLVVEDEPALCQLITTILRKEGHNSVAAPSANAALALLAHETFDLVMVDVRLGLGMDGIELTRLIRTTPRWAEVPILVMTGDVFGPAQAVAAGASAVVIKPYDVPVLLARIAELLALTEAETDFPQEELRARSSVYM